MANTLNVSNAEKQLCILKHYINGLLEPDGFPSLKGFKDFDDIISKPSSNSFKDYTFEGLSADIAELVDNTENEISYRKFNTSANKLSIEWNDRLIIIRKCIDCYYNWTTEEENEDFFTKVCAEPHLLVYIQRTRDYGSRLWPAKVLSIDDAGLMLYEFFGSHAQGNTNVNDFYCVLYSDTDENLCKKITDAINSTKKIKKEEFVRALKEVQVYIKNIRQRYGANSFVPASASIEDQVITDINQHLKQMYPAAFSQNIQIKSEDVEMQPDDGTFSEISSPASRGRGSRDDSDYLNDSDDADHEILPNRQPRRLVITEIKKEYSPHYADAAAAADGDGPDVKVQAADDDTDSSIRTNNSRREISKRKNSGAMRRAAKRAPRTSLYVANERSKVIIINDESDTERPSTSTQNNDVGSSTVDEENLEKLLKENNEIVREIWKCDKHLKALKAQKAVVDAKIKEYLN